MRNHSLTRRAMCALAVTLASCAGARADIKNWQTGQTIPGTEGISPGPYVDLSYWNSDPHNLRYANLSGGLDLNHGYFDGSWLDYARFTQADLSSAMFEFATLTSADLSGANLTDADLVESTLVNCDLSRANLTRAYIGFADLGLFAKLTGADLTDAVVKGTFFSGSTLFGLTKEQLYSTASYKDRDLKGIDLSVNDLSGWDFAGQNLANSNFEKANLDHADLSRANLTGAQFYDAYLRFADLREANLTHVHFGSLVSNERMTHADLSRADMRGSWYFTPSPDQDVTMSNTILNWGGVEGMSLGDGETMPIRDYDGGIPIKIDNGMTLGSGSMLEVLFSDATWGSTITLRGGFTPDLGGTLKLSFAADADLPALVGTTFDLFNWNGQLLPGDYFDRIESLPGFMWDTSNLYSTGEVTLMAVPEPATLMLLLGAVGTVGLRRGRGPGGPRPPQRCYSSENRPAVPSCSA